MGITRQQALDCFASDDLIGIGMEADAVRRKLHPEHTVSYTLERALDSAISDPEARHRSARSSVDLGATSLLLTGAANPCLTVSHYENLLGSLRRDFPTLQLYGLSATHIVAIAASSELPLRDTLLRLRDAGLDAIAGSAILFDDTIRQRATPRRCTTAEWLSVHRTAHQLGLPTAATMVFGVGETVDQRIDHLEVLRALQEDTGGFISFTPLSHPPSAGGPSEDILEPSEDILEPTAVEYLKTLSVSRLYLDTVGNLQASWPTQGLKVLQMCLRFGANDAGPALVEDRFGRPGGATEEELRRIIREAGFRPAQRDALFRTLFLN